MDLETRIGLGALAGLVATKAMDIATDALYTEDLKKREHKVARTSAGAALARRMFKRLDLKPTDEGVTKAANLLHWSIGIGGGMLAGLLAGRNTLPASLSAGLIASGMYAFDEFGLAELGVVPPSSRYPWQTNARSAIGHATFALTFAMTYAVARSLASRCE